MKATRIGAFLLALLAPFVSGVTQPTLANGEEQQLRNSDLIAMATPVRSFQPRDEFDAAPTVQLVGRRFQIDLPVRQGGSGGCTSLPFWRYDPDKRRLELTFFGDRRSSYFIRGKDGRVHSPLSDAGNFETAPVQCSEISQGTYRASNVFGAMTTIHRQRQTVVEIAAIWPPSNSDHPYFIMTSLEMEPSVARATVGNIRLRYSGYLTAWSNGTSLACGIEHAEPDMQSYFDRTVDTCIFRGVVEHIAFVDSASGWVLVERAFVSEPHP